METRGMDWIIWAGVVFFIIGTCLVVDRVSRSIKRVATRRVSCLLSSQLKTFLFLSAKRTTGNAGLPQLASLFYLLRVCSHPAALHSSIFFSFGISIRSSCSFTVLKASIVRSFHFIPHFIFVIVTDMLVIAFLT